MTNTTKRNCFLSLLFLAVLLLYPCHAGGGEAEDAAANMGSMALEAYGSEGGIAERVSRPMTSDDTPMPTLDSSQTFNAQLTCPSSRKFLEVFLQVSSTGDLSQVVVSQDTDMDGTTDYSYQVPFIVSGVCANGLVSCDAGTWVDCSYYTWTADQDGRAGLQEVAITDLGACYCINNDCGNNLVWSNLAAVLKDIGGGVVGAIQAVNPKYAITDVKVDGPVLTYYGQDSVSCTSVTSSYGSASPEQYYNDPYALTGDAEAEVLSQSQDSDSYYSLVEGVALTNDNAVQLIRCSINRVVTVTIQENSVSGNGSGSICSDHYLYARVYKENDTTYHLQLLDTGPGGEPHKNCGHGGGWHTLETVTLLAPPDSILFCLNSTGGGCGNTATTCTYLANQSVNVITCGASGAQYPSYNYSYSFTYREDSLSEYISDNCQTLEGDPGCRLRDEVVDDVDTYRDFNPTGLYPLQSCRTFTGVESYELCRDWWAKEREYLCETEESFDFSDVLDRTGAVVTTATDNTTTLYYQDMRKDEYGNWITEANTIDLAERGSYDDCEEACKTRVPRTDTQAGITGHTAQTRTTTQSYDFFYKKCADDSCPLEPGEEVVKDCQCINDFAEAASIMTTLESASKDLICSSGVKQ